MVFFQFFDAEAQCLTQRLQLDLGAFTGMGFKQIFKASIQKIFKGSKKIFIFPALVQCFGPFMPVSNLAVFESPGPSVLSPGPLLLWSLGPLLLWSLAPLVPWSSGPLVLRSLGPPVFWSLGPSVLWWL